MRRNFVGEFGDKIGAIVVFYDPDARQRSMPLLNSLSLIFDPFLSLNFEQGNSRNLRKHRSKFRSKEKIFIFTSLRGIEISDLQNLKDNGHLIGFLEMSLESPTDDERKKFALLDKIITTSRESEDLLKNYAPHNEVRRISLAMDLRPFYHLKLGQNLTKYRNVGFLCTRDSLKLLTENLYRIEQHLMINNDVVFVIQCKDLTVDEYNFVKKIVKKSLKRNILIMDPNYSIWQKLEFFKSIDFILELNIRSDFYDTNDFIEAEAAGITKIFLEDFENDILLSQPSSYDLHSPVHSNDFRLLKFKYIKIFFGFDAGFHGNPAVNVVPSDAGFFSVFNTLISIKSHWTGIHGYSKISPNWNVLTVLDFWKTDVLTSYCYAGEEEQNVFFKLFSNTDGFLNDETSGSKTLQAHSPNLYADPDLTYVYADRLYRSAGYQVWRDEMNSALENLCPNPDMVTKIDEVFPHVTSEDLIIGMHVRHPSHAMEQPGSQIPGIQDFITVAQGLISENRNNFEKIYIFLATDQQVVVDRFMDVFKDKLLFFKEVTRVSVQQSADFDALKDEEKLKNGFQVQHLAASDRTRWSSKLAEEIICDAWALARSNIFIHSVSNVATAVTYINPKLNAIPIRKGDTLSSARKRMHLAKLTSLI